MTVQTHYVRMTAYGTKAASRHLEYIQGDGVQPDGSRGVLYGPEGPAADADAPAKTDQIDADVLALGEALRPEIRRLPDQAHRELDLTVPSNEAALLEPDCFNRLRAVIAQWP